MFDNILSNCGEISPDFTYGHCQLQPSVKDAAIPFFHDQLCQWGNAIPNMVSWVLVIQPTSPAFLRNEITNKIADIYEPISNRGDDWNLTQGYQDTMSNANQNVIGCIFAQGVSIPGHTSNIEHTTLNTPGGFSSAPMMVGRADHGNLAVGFLETNSSFADFVLRPWSIVAAHRGLAEVGESIKANITVYQLAKNNDSCSGSVVRKRYNYYKCVPISLGNEDLEYTPGGVSKRQVEFVYNTYSVTDYSKVRRPESSGIQGDLAINARDQNPAPLGVQPSIATPGIFA